LDEGKPKWLPGLALENRQIGEASDKPDVRTVEVLQLCCRFCADLMRGKMALLGQIDLLIRMEEVVTQSRDLSCP